MSETYGVILGLLCISIALKLFHTYQIMLVHGELKELIDKIGFGVTVPADQIPRVMDEIHGRIGGMGGERPRKARKPAVSELDELSEMDREVPGA